MGTIANVRTRSAMLASWRAAQRQTDMVGAVLLTHASAAGMLLDQHDGSVDVALAKCPREPWWDLVRRYLTELAAAEVAELADTQRPKATG